MLKKVTFSRQRVHRDFVKEFSIRFVTSLLNRGSLKALLDFCDPIVSGRSTVRTKQVVSLDCLEFKEATFLRLFRSARGVVTLNNSGDLREVDVVSALEVLARVIIPQLMLGGVQHKPSLLPAFDPKICLKKNPENFRQAAVSLIICRC